jgi:LysM repeat protein
VGDGWRRYAAPAAFLLAVTVAVVLVRSGIERGGNGVAVTTTVAKPPHKRVAVTTTTTAKRTKPKSGARFWTVRAGDTFGVISAQTGVPVATIEQLNPNVSSTSLFIGEKIRIK